MFVAPLLLIIGPLVPAGLIALFLRRWPIISGFVGGLVALAWGQFIGNWSLANPDFNTFSLYGRSLVLDEGGQRLFVLLYLAFGVLALLSAVWEQGADFVPAGFATLSAFAAMLTIQPFTFGLVALLVAAALGAMLIQSGRVGSTLASWRYLMLTALALPFLLIAGWMLDSGQLVFLPTVWRLLLIGFIILLAGFPFTGWVRPILKEAPPLAAAYILGLGQLAIVSFAFRLLADYPVIRLNTAFLPLLRGSGGATLAVAGLLAFNSRKVSQLVGYLVLADMGGVILSLVSGPAGLPVAISLLTQRFVGLVLAGIGFLLIGNEVDLFTAGRGLAARKPLGVILVTLAILSLIGLPLTPGFSGRWQLVALVATSESHWLAMLIWLVAASGSVGLLGALREWLTPAGTATPTDSPPLLRQLLVALAIAVGLLLGLFPQPLLNLASQLAHQLTP